MIRQYLSRLSEGVCRLFVSLDQSPKPQLPQQPPYRPIELHPRDAGRDYRNNGRYRPGLRK
ncbi:MAG: hypothetical protein WC796_00550 [Candidatus Pacearchaeota archaeon]|jgi:hypothetical protein